MEGEGGATSIPAWTQSWFTPSILFLLLNVIIGTISKGIARTDHRDHQQQNNQPEEEEEEEHRAPYISGSTPSILTRLRSIGSFSRSASADTPSESTPPAQAETSPDPAEHGDGWVRDHQLGRSQSEAYPKAEAAEGRMHESASARSVADVEKRAGEEVDARADDFINRFRNQLRLEEADARADDFINRLRDQLRLQIRLDSIIRYKDMLINRGEPS